MTGSFVGAGVGTGGAIALGVGDGMAEGLRVLTVVLGCLLGLGHGIRDGAGVVGSPIGAVVCAGDRLQLSGLAGIGKGCEVSDLVAGSLS